MFVKLNVQGDLLEKLTEDSKRRHRSCTQQVMFILDMYYNYKHVYDSRCEPEDLTQRSLPMDYMAQKDLVLRENPLNTNHHPNTHSTDSYNNNEYNNNEYDNNDDDDDEMYDDEFDSAYNF